MYLPEEKNIAEKLFLEADVVILGVKLKKLLHRRLKSKKITFLFSERPFKKKPSLFRLLKNKISYAKEYLLYDKRNFYLLSASAYSADDYKKLGLFNGNAFSWGYFPPCRMYEEKELFALKSDSTLKIFWAGRFLDWKKPYYVLEVAKALKEVNVNFHINMAGCGDLYADVEKAIAKNGLKNEISLCGAIEQGKVREYMEKSNIYLFTSNREEGFGAVLTEAMNSGCAVVASETAGATKLLIVDGENGRIYKDDNCEQFVDIVVQLAKDRKELEKLGSKAYKTIIDLQNAKVASKRFSEVLEKILNKEQIPLYNEGPMKKMR